MIMKYLKNNLSLFLLLCIIFLFPVRWYKTSISAVNDFKGITVMVHDYFRIAALYILVIMIQAVADRDKCARFLAVAAQLVLLMYFMIFPAFMYQVSGVLFWSQLFVCYQSYAEGFYISVVFICLSVGINVRKMIT